MPIIESKINGRSAEFANNASAMREKVFELKAVLEKLRKVVQRPRGKNILQEESYCHASVSSNCWTRARLFWSFLRLRHMACMTTMHPVRASLQA